MKERNKIRRFFGLHPQNDVRRKFAFTLAEGATHVGNSNNKRRFAFTLAEVLVTLGIIGVVAVLTVPNVISSYQKKVYVTQLQKAYSQLQQVFDLAMAEDEVEYLADTELMQSMNGDRIGASDDQSAFSSKLGEYMKIQKACQPREFSDGCHDICYLELYENDSGSSQVNPDLGSNDNSSDEEEDFGAFGDLFSLRTPKNASSVAKTRGTCMGSNRGASLQIFTKDAMIYYFPYGFLSYPRSESEEYCEEIRADGGNVCSYHADFNGSSSIEVDVNAKKGPNRYGRDMFRFALDDKGQLYLAGAPSFSGNSGSYLEAIHWGCNALAAYGIGCAAKIMDDGWVMDY